jgi:tyrosine-protein kinase Etk/Wzc
MIAGTSENPLPPVQDESIDLLKLAAVFLAEWRVGLVTAVIVFLLGTIITFSIKPLFEANASLLPHETLAPSNSLAAIFSAKSPEDLYLGLLASRGVADQVIAQEDLLRVFHTKSLSAARAKLKDASKFTIGKEDTLVHIRVRNADSEKAAAIANAYIDALQSQQESMSESQAKVRRVIFEKEMDEEKEALTAAENALKNDQEASGLVQITSQTELGLTAIASVRAQLTSLQVQLAALQTSYTEDSPEVKTLKSQIARLTEHERELESGANNVVGAALPTGKMPEANLEYLRKFRDVKYHEALLTALATQYETAHFAEDNSITQFQVVDRAISPERKSWPPRLILLILSFVFGLIIGSVAIVFKIFIRRLSADPIQREYLRSIRENFRFAK